MGASGSDGGSHAVDAVGVAVVGLGYWGPKLLRVLHELPGAHPVAACDTDAEACAVHAQRYPDLEVVGDLDTLLADDRVEAVIVATPIGSHVEIARRALLAGKHVLVEKPMAPSVEECVELIDLAGERGLTLMPGHTYLYSPAVQAIADLLSAGDLGDVLYVTSSRVNLGGHRPDYNVICDLAPHDLSIMHYWFGWPTFIRAIGRSSVLPGVEDVAFIDVGFPSGLLVHITLSWLAPAKERRTVLVGEHKMVVYEDTLAEPVSVFDRRAELDGDPALNGKAPTVQYQWGEVVRPSLADDEPLNLELADFLNSVRTGCKPRVTAHAGLQIVQLIQAAERSMSEGGGPVFLDEPSQGNVAEPVAADGKR